MRKILYNWQPINLFPKILILLFLVSPQVVHGSGPLVKADKAVYKYLKALQEWKCDSLFDLVYHYNQMMYYERQMYPEALWAEIKNKYKKDWQDRCVSFEKDISKKDGSFGGDAFFVYVTPKTHWKIIESRPREVFVKMTYTKEEAPCKEQADDSYKSHLLKSRIYSFPISYSKGKILVHGPRDLSTPESDTFYADECQQGEEVQGSLDELKE